MNTVRRTSKRSVSVATANSFVCTSEIVGDKSAPNTQIFRDSAALAGDGDLVRRAVHQLGARQFLDQIGIGMPVFHQRDAMG